MGFPNPFGGRRSFLNPLGLQGPQQSGFLPRPLNRALDPAGILPGGRNAPPGLRQRHAAPASEPGLRDPNDPSNAGGAIPRNPGMPPGPGTPGAPSEPGAGGPTTDLPGPGWQGDPYREPMPRGDFPNPPPSGPPPVADERGGNQTQPVGPGERGPADGDTPPPGGFPSELPQRGNTGTLTGYPETLGRSMKHIFGAIASRYPNTPSGLDALMRDPEFQRWFPNARRIDEDEIDFGGQLSDIDGGVPVGLVDVIRAADGPEGGNAWQWIDQAFNQDGGGGGGGGIGDAANNLGGMPGGSDIIAALTAGDGLQSSELMKQIQARLQQLLSGDGASALPEQL